MSIDDEENLCSCHSDLPARQRPESRSTRAKVVQVTLPMTTIALISSTRLEINIAPNWPMMTVTFWRSLIQNSGLQYHPVRSSTLLLNLASRHSNVYHSEKQLFVLNFRGLSFEFHIESRFEPRYAHGLGSLQFPNGASPVVSRMYIYTGASLEDTRAPPLPLSCYHGNCFLEYLEVVRERNVTVALKFHLVTEGKNMGASAGNGPAKLSELRKVTCERTVKFKDTCQDVVSSLGSPSKIFFKSEDKMKIHSPDANRMVKSRCADYFFNYTTLGVDILFDANTHRVKKFILHSNFPGHYDFNMYYRCDFVIPVTVEKPVDGATTMDHDHHLDIHYDTRVMQNSHIASVTLYQPKSSYSSVDMMGS
ncbi:hypothetical protein LSH36_690g02001 [Paralvinella palmiformis]|uniref:Uncharacterized protein n=1 Tax=Paralvinella palmiformis TaxID=53620 RepID=A0AAD9J2T6_9ANNE|nr:hypothetical protein LSH36_690g02001 [Paralvinella palmiformis]